jgi:RNA polymerase sigma factor (sigma-70 family)
MGIATAPTVSPLKRDSDETSDHELVARLRAGDDRAFERLYTRYHRRIASYVQGMVHDHARAEDITQDVFMSALRRMRETDRPIAFKPWIYEIAKNACIDQFRRARRAEEVSMDAEEGLGSADYGRLVTKDPAPDAAFDTKQQLDHLQGAFGGLSETHHQILVMRELEGLSYREIGDRLGMTRPAVESTLFRARRRLTEEYEELVTGERCQRVQAIIAGADGSILGARDRKRVARHVSYCQPCLRQARMSGIEPGELVHKPVRAKIAALLPLPAFLRKRWGGEDAVAGGGDGSSLATWSAQLSSVDPTMVSGWGKAAATAATIALAGVGAGVATQKPDSIASALGGGSVTERIEGGSGTEQRAQGARLVAASTAGAAGRTRGAGSGAGSSSSASSRGRRSIVPAGGQRTVRKGAAGKAGGAGGASTTSALSVDAGGTADSAGTAAKKPAEDAGGGGVAGLLPGGAGGGGGGNGSSGSPAVEVPAAVSDPVQTASDAVGQVTGGSTTGESGGGKDEGAVEGVVNQLEDTVTGVLGGK